MSTVNSLLNLRNTDKLASPNKILRSLPPLDAEKIIALTVLLAPKIPADLYAEMVNHAK